jgi:hypothetical protein
MQWPKRLLARWLTWVAKPTPPLLALPNLTDQGLYSSHGIDINHFSHIYDPEYRLWRCHVLFSPVEVYTRQLESATRALVENTGIMPHAYNVPIQSIALWQFFLDSQGRYIEPVQAVKEWQAAADAFILEYRSCDAVAGSRQAHTLQVLDALLSNTVTLLNLFETV